MSVHGADGDSQRHNRQLQLEGTSQYDLFTVGAGYLDVWAALNYTSLPPAGAATSPIAVYNSLNVA